MNIRKNKLLRTLLLASSVLLLLSTQSFASSSNHEIKVKESCKSRLILIPDNYDKFKNEAIKWISKCVKSGRKKIKREVKLVNKKSNLAEIWEHVKNMNGTEVGVEANYKGKNRVRSIVFSLRGFDSPVIAFEPEIVKVDSMLKKRWRKKARDINKGKLSIKKLLKLSKKHVKKIASMPDNPIGSPEQSEILSLLREAHPKKLAKYTVGSLIDVLTANQSKDVAKARRNLYQSYSNGVAKALDKNYRINERAISSFEAEFFDLGFNKANSLKPIEKHQLRFYLIESNRTYSFKGFNPIEPTKSYFKSKYHGGVYQQSLMNHFSDAKFRYR